MTKPAGLEIALFIYLVSEKTGVEIRVGMRNLPFMPTLPSDPSPQSIINSLKLDLPEQAIDWRFMTKDEIAIYKSENDDL